MKTLLSCIVWLGLAAALPASTINFSASIDHGFSLASGTNLPTGSAVRLGYFASGGVQLTDAQIAAASVSTLESSFIQIGSTTIGSGVGNAAGHFAAAASADTTSVTGKQIYLWVINAATSGTATQQAILYWDISNTSTNPDSAPVVPGSRWAFPAQSPVPGVTTIDITDLTTGTASLASGAHLVVGTFSTGTSSATSAVNFGLVAIGTPPVISTTSPLAGGTVGAAYSQTLAATGGTTPYTWTVDSGSVPPSLTLSSAGVLGGTPSAAGTFTFTAKVADSASGSATQSFSVTIAEPLSNYLTGYGLAADSTDLDSDNDGTSNLVEFLLGGNPTVSDPSILPVAALEAGTFTYSFNITANPGSVIWNVQYNSDLSADWTDAVNGTDGVTITTTPGDGVNRVTVTLPSVLEKCFVRLRASGP